MSKENELSQEKRMLHIEEMKEEVLRLVKDPECFYLDDSLSLEMQEKILEQILFMEGSEERPMSEYLEQEGISLPRPQDLDDTQLQSKLWEVINAMALAGHFLSSTDHLSDRDLYELLWSDILRQPTSISPDPSTTTCHIDILGGCSEEDQRIRLKYYADDDERDCWENDFPDDELPPKEPLPYDRDRHLPVPENSAF
jgi:hypothetical protein